jgi:hypothetical protein
MTLRKQVVALFADRSCQRGLVRDPEGNFWIVPSVETRPVRKRACGETSLLCETGQNTLTSLLFHSDRLFPQDAGAWSIRC